MTRLGDAAPETEHFRRRYHGATRDAKEDAATSVKTTGGHA
jgi:hypothetical protein